MIQWFNSFLGGYAHRILDAVILLVIGVVVIKYLMMAVKKALSKSKLVKAAHKLVQAVVKTVLYFLLFLPSVNP